MAKCANRRSMGLSLLLCGRATAGKVTLATWPSPLDLIVALEDREGAVPCADSCDSIGNGIDYCSWTWRFVSVCVGHVWALLIDENKLIVLNNRDKMGVVWLCRVFWMIHGVLWNSRPIGLKHKIYSPFGRYTLSAPSHTPPLWRTKELLGPWRGYSWSHRVMSSLHLISITAVIKAKDAEDEVAQSDIYGILNLWEWRCFSPDWNTEKNWSKIKNLNKAMCVCVCFQLNQLRKRIFFNLKLWIINDIRLACHMHTNHQQLILANQLHCLLILKTQNSLMLMLINRMTIK